MIGSRRNLIFAIALGALLLTNCMHMTASEQKPEWVSPEDQLFLESIVTALKSMTGEVDIGRFSGDQSLFIRLGNIIDKQPSVAHRVISTLVGSLDDMTPTKVNYHGKAVPLGVMCYEALHSICYYEASDKNGNITALDGTVLPGASKTDLKTAKRAWKRILKRRAYIML